MALKRETADELVISSILGLVAVSDITAPYSTEIYASDASMNKGAYVAKDLNPILARSLWLCGDRKGGYTMLDSPARSQLRVLGLDDDGFAADGPGF